MNEIESIVARREARYPKLFSAARDMIAALEAYEKLDDFHANCEECDGVVPPEACEYCFPFADYARLKMRAALAKARGEA